MSHRIVIAACFAAFAIPAVAQQGAAPAAPEFTRETVGDWTVICAKSGSPCAMEQIAKTSAGENAIPVQIERLPKPTTVEGKRGEAVANFLVPFPSVPQAGLRMQVDSSQTKTFPFLVCQANGCIVQVFLDDESIAGFRRGARANLVFSSVAEGKAKPIEASVSLSGFTRAFDALKK